MTPNETLQVNVGGQGGTGGHEAGGFNGGGGSAATGGLSSVAGGGGGGGGSDYTGTATHVTVTDGYQSGQVTISYTVLAVTTTSLPAATGGTPTPPRWPRPAGSRRTHGPSRPGRCRPGFP